MKKLEQYKIAPQAKFVKFKVKHLSNVRVWSKVIKRTSNNQKLQEHQNQDFKQNMQ